MMAAVEGALGLTILHFLWQGALLGLAAALVLRSMRQAPAAHRHAVAWLALLACLAWPAAELAGRTRAALDEQAGMTVYRSQPRPTAPPRNITVGDVAGQHGSLVVAAWAAGALLLTLRTGIGLVWIRRRAHGPDGAGWERRTAALAARMGIRRKVGVRLMGDLDSPVTAGWRRPLILLPAPLAASLPALQMDALLAHELAHIRRHDYAANLLQTAIVTLLFFHPAAWWLARRINAERELLADGLAARTLDDPRSLAQALAELDRHRHNGMHPAQAASGGELLARVRALVAPQAAALRLGVVIPAALAAVAGVAVAAHAASDATGRTLTRTAWIDFTTCVKPEWPAASLAAEHTGTVTLRFQIGRDGTVNGGEVRRSSGHPALDQAALNGISRCRFKPAQVDGMPVATSQQMQYVWTLQ